uniref:Teneurin-2 n=1 Tax=Magallana gigas TaxID=29159 RepID=K1QCB2_MAGGI
MKVVLVLACVLVAVYAETCKAPGDCSQTSCGSGAELHCIDGQCTCTTAAGGDVSAETCNILGDCTTTTCSGGAELHCVDGQCTCTTAAGGTGGCTDNGDCHGRCHNGGRHHCINGHCRCSH